LEVDEVDDFEEAEKLQYEQDLMGIYVSGHPLDSFSELIKKLSSTCIANVQDMAGEGKRDMTLAGMISGQKALLTKKGDRMCFATLEDLSGKIELVVFPKAYAEYEHLITAGEPVLITGQVNLDESPRKFFPNKIQVLKDQIEDRVTGVRFQVDLDGLNEGRLNRLKQVLLSYRGSVPAHIIFTDSDNQIRGRLSLGDNYLINPSPHMASKVNDVLMGNSVKFIVDGRLEDIQ